MPRPDHVGAAAAMQGARACMWRVEAEECEQRQLSLQCCAQALADTCFPAAASREARLLHGKSARRSPE